MAVSPDYDSPLALKAFLEEHGLGMQKKFGQNFLVHRPTRERLAEALSVEQGTRVWEIGPGLGSMTAPLLDRGAEVTVFEIDRGFCEILRGIFADRPNFTLVEGDVLKNWKKELELSGMPDRLFGNLPYNISAAIIGDMIASGVRFEKAVLTVQKEVALRIAAKAGSEDYSSFSVLCQWAYEVKPLMDLAGGNFWPQPNVTSRSVELKRRLDWPACRNPEVFLSMQRALFSSRRKTVRNNLSAYLAGRLPAETIISGDNSIVSVILAEAAIDPGIRAECLTIADFLRLSDVIDGVLEKNK